MPSRRFTRRRRRPSVASPLHPKDRRNRGLPTRLPAYAARTWQEPRRRKRRCLQSRGRPHRLTEKPGEHDDRHPASTSGVPRGFGLVGRMGGERVAPVRPLLRIPMRSARWMWEGVVVLRQILLPLLPLSRHLRPHLDRPPASSLDPDRPPSAFLAPACENHEGRLDRGIHAVGGRLHKPRGIFRKLFDRRFQELRDKTYWRRHRALEYRARSHEELR